MTRSRRLAALAGLAGLALPAPAFAADPADLLDRAAACRRRAQPACTLEQADAALAALGDAEGDLRREALLLRAEALALLDRPADARDAFAALLAAWPGWRPSPGADPRIIAAVDAAEAARLAKRLPPALEPGPPPLPSPPSPADLLPPPLLYAPPDLMALTPDDTTRRWRLGLGGGVALVGGASADRIDTGATALISLGYAPTERWELHLQAILGLHSLDDGLRAEPNYSRGLTTVAATLGATYAHPVGDGFEVVAGLGAGGGSFGLRSLVEAPSFALTACVGARYFISPHFGVRLDALPVLFVPLDGPPAAAAHTAVVARTEVRF